jgi:hypothetical protein
VRERKRLRALEELPEFLLGKRIEHIDLCARKQRAVHLERGIFGGGADEGEQTFLDEG